MGNERGAGGPATAPGCRTARWAVGTPTDLKCSRRGSRRSGERELRWAPGAPRRGDGIGLASSRSGESPGMGGSRRGPQPTRRAGQAHLSGEERETARAASGSPPTGDRSGPTVLKIAHQHGGCGVDPVRGSAPTGQFLAGGGAREARAWTGRPGRSAAGAPRTKAARGPGGRTRPGRSRPAGGKHPATPRSGSPRRNACRTGAKAG